MEENYTYPVVFDFSEQDVIQIKMPNFSDEVNIVDAEEDKIKAAQEILAMTIADYEDRKIKLPEPLKIDEIEVKENQQLVFINVWMPYYRSQIKIEYVKKNLTIPTWLDQLAKSRHVNYSALLVKALKEELKIK